MSLKFGKATNQNRRKKAYRLLDERIQRLVDDYGNVDLSEYLKGLAANMSL